MSPHPRRVRRLTVLTCAGLAVGAGAAAALVALPEGQRVNDDPANGIVPTLNAGIVDVAGARTSPTAPLTPWAAFEQATTGAQQIFVREFVNGRWETRGAPASLNLDTTQTAEHPAIDLAGPGGTVPWVAWYEPSTQVGGGATQIFASRFAAAANRWLPSGQDRSAGRSVPSMNINTDRAAENPSLAGGNPVAGGAPEPWIAWQEDDGPVAGQRSQIFVSHAVKSTGSCAGRFPGSGPAVNGFCWQAVGTARVSPASFAPAAPTDPSLNIDVRRNAVEADVAFTGPGDTVPWVVWYETGPGGPGLPGNDLVFAAKAVPDAAAVGGFRWVAVGNNGAGDLGVNTPCAASATAVRACSLNQDPARGAVDARVAAGSMAPGGTTAPWVVWSEDLGNGRNGVFVSHLVGERFVVINGGRPISPAGVNATVPDITFSGNTPYITWREDAGNVGVGHLEGPGSAPAFVLDDITPAIGAGRPAVTSFCPASPLTADGAACPAGAAGTPVTAFTDSTGGPAGLFAKAWGTGAASTQPATAVATGTATFNGSVDALGAKGKAFFEFGPTVAYGSATAPEALAATRGVRTFSSAQTGLSGVVHFRAVVVTDVGRQVGADQVVAVPAPAPAPGTVAGPAPVPVVVNRAPALRLTAPRVLSVRRGTRPRVALSLSVDEAATVSVQVRRGRAVVGRAVVRRTRAGAFSVKVPLGRVSRAGSYRVSISARDAQGATTTASRVVRVAVRR